MFLILRMNIIINFNFPIPLHNFNGHCNWSIVDQNLIVIIKRNTPPRLQTREYIPRISTLTIFSCLHAGQQEDDQFKPSHCFQTMIIILLLKILFPPSWNVGHFKIFPTDYGDGEKILQPLIIKHCECVWVIKYVLIKVPCSFPYISLYIAACTLSIRQHPKTMYN